MEQQQKQITLQIKGDFKGDFKGFVQDINGKVYKLPFTALDGRFWNVKEVKPHYDRGIYYRINGKAIHEKKLFSNFQENQRTETFTYSKRAARQKEKA